MCYMCLHPFVSTCYKWFRVCEPMFLNILNYVSLCRRFLRAYVPTSQNKPLQIHDREKYGYSHLFFFSWHYDVVVITTAQLHSTKPKLRHRAGSNPACRRFLRPRLEIRLNAFHRSTIPQKQFIMIIMIIIIIWEEAFPYIRKSIGTNFPYLRNVWVV